MERFLSNYKGPPTKGKTNPRTMNSALANKEYDANKRQRHFVDSWKTTFPWAVELGYADRKYIACSVCREYTEIKLSPDPTEQDFKNYPFIHGSSSYRKASLEAHEKSVQHVLYATKKQKVLSGEQNTILTSLSAKEKSHLMPLYKNAYAVMKSGKPWLDYEFICQLDVAKGLDIGKTYLNRTSGQEFGKHICCTILKQIVQQFMGAKFFVIMLDEATDVSHLEQVILYIRYSKQAIIHTQFCGIFSVSRANAQQITDGVLACLKNRLGWKSATADNVDLVNSDSDNDAEANETTTIDSDTCMSDEENMESIADIPSVSFQDINSAEESETDKQPLMVGMVSDGASVLSGNKAGVQAKLKSVNPHLLYVWCISHRLQLAIKDGMKSGCKRFDELHEFLKALYLFHTQSNVVHAAYQNAVEVNNRTGSVTVIRVDGTRWIFHMMSALTNVLNALDCHCDCLSALKNADKFSAAQKAKCVYFQKKIQDTCFVEFMIFPLDVLTALSRFSLFSQTRNVSFPVVQSSLDSCIDRLQLLRQDLTRGTEWSRYQRGDYADRLAKCNMTGKDTHLSQATATSTLDVLIDCLTKRCSVSIPEELDKLSPLLNTKAWKKDNLFTLKSVSGNGLRSWDVSDWMDDELAKLGEIQWISEQLERQGVDVSEILVEWRAFKRKLPHLTLDWAHTDRITWSSILTQIPHTEYENLAHLIDFIGTFGVSSAEAERGFSQLKVVKTDKRSRLGQTPLQDQLLVKLEGPSLEAFDPEPAIQSWIAGRQRARRPSFMDNQREATKFGPKVRKTCP